MPPKKMLRRRPPPRRIGPKPLSFNPTPLAGRHRVVIAYQAGKNLTEATFGAGATQVWSLTGPYDPDVTGAGVQPVGFDPWMNMYTNYLITKVSYELTFVNTVASTVRVGFVMNNINALPPTTPAWPVDPNGKCRVLGSTSGSRAATTFTGTVIPSKVLQVPWSSYYSEADYMGSAIGNPLRQVYLMTYVTGTSAVGNVDTVVRISYEMELRNPIPMSTS